MEAVRSFETSVNLFQKMLLFALVLLLRCTLDILVKYSEIVSDKAETVLEKGLLSVRPYE
jgi:hypothetical protein